MRLYLVRRTDDVDWDEYDSFVVAAEDADTALRTHPNGDGDPVPETRRFGTWVANLGVLTVEDIGEAAPGILAGKVLIASFNAG